MADINTGASIRGLLPALSVILLLLVLFIALGLIGGGEKILPGRTASAINKAPTDDKTLVVGKQSAAYQQSWPGIIRSKTVASIAPRHGARIISVNVNAGDNITKGAVIAQLDARDLRSALDQSRAALTAAEALAGQARADFQRSRYLFDKQAVTRADHDAAAANVKSRQAAVSEARSAVEQARLNWEEATLKAPFDGVVSQRLKEAGDMGLPGDAVAVLIRADDLRLEAAIPNTCMSRIKLGDPVKAIIEARPEPITAIVDEIAPEIDIHTGTRLVKAKLQAQNDLKHGQFAWLEQSCEEKRDSLLIPVSAVMRYGQLETVAVVSDNRIIFRHIRTGKRQDNHVEVLSGLRAGETIIADVGADPGPE